MTGGREEQGHHGVKSLIYKEGRPKRNRCAKMIARSRRSCLAPRADRHAAAAAVARTCFKPFKPTGIRILTTRSNFLVFLFILGVAGVIAFSILAVTTQNSKSSCPCANPYKQIGYERILDMGE